MEGLILNIVILFITGVISFGLFFIVLNNSKIFDLNTRKEKADKILKESEEEAKEIIEQSNKDYSEQKENIEQEFIRRTERINKIEESLQEREETILKREERNNQTKLSLVKEEEALQEKQSKIEMVEKEIVEKLCSKTGSNVLGLKEEIIQGYNNDLAKDFSERLANIENNLKETASKRAKRIVVSVMQKICTPTSVETRTVNIKVPKDKIKGKIVGKDGTNIRHLESKVDVDIVFNDLPNTISISAFNLVNRRIAQKAIEKLIQVRDDIDHSVIDKCFEKAEKETDDELYELGKNAIDDMGIKVENNELIRIIGRLQYRTSYGQNIMKHSKEVGWISALLGSEIGLDEKTCLIGGFLHDLGKAIDQDPNITGGHDYLTKELMEKYGFPEEEVHAAWVHHYAEPPQTPVALIVIAADAISACRPGARQESLDRYIERLKALEETAKSFDGVKSTYAISAGREVRIIVDPEKIDDIKMGILAEDVAKKIEDSLAYPGTIKVNVIRRTQHTEIAK